MNGVFTFQSRSPGPSVVIMAGVHGNEHSGILALQRIINEGISLVQGTVTLIFANLDAIEKDVRFVEINMNRCFGRELGNTKEEIRVKELLPYLQQADILLDLHNTIGVSANPFLISEHSNYNKLFDCQYVVSGLDVLHPGGSDGYMNSLGKVGLCLECGSITDSIDMTTDYAYRMITNFLCYLCLIDGSYQLYPDQKELKAQMMYASQSERFILQKSFYEFEQCHTGQIIGYDDGKKVVAPYDGYIFFARESDQKGVECFVYGS